MYEGEPWQYHYKEGIQIIITYFKKKMDEIFDGCDNKILGQFFSVLEPVS